MYERFIIIYNLFVNNPRFFVETYNRLMFDYINLNNS